MFDWLKRKKREQEKPGKTGDASSHEVADGGGDVPYIHTDWGLSPDSGSHDCVPSDSGEFDATGGCDMGGFDGSAGGVE